MSCLMDLSGDSSRSRGPIGHRQKNYAENTDLKHRSCPLGQISLGKAISVKSARGHWSSLRCFGTIGVTVAPGRAGPNNASGRRNGMPGVKRERDDSVGVLTLDEPETLNAMTPDLLGDLATAIGEVNDNPQVRALVLTGAGRGFCSGQNLKAAQILGDDIAAGVMKYYWPTFKALRECRVPIVVAVNGVAAGGGFSLAMAGDMIVAARSARFIQVFSRIALVPDLGSTWLLPRLVGRQRALELMMTNEPLTAEQAKEWGLVREVFDDTALGDGALELARKLASGPTRALAATRRLIDESEHASYADQFRREIETQAQIRLSADAMEGRNAFLEKRAAVFTGR